MRVYNVHVELKAEAGSFLWTRRNKNGMEEPQDFLIDQIVKDIGGSHRYVA